MNFTNLFNVFRDPIYLLKSILHYVTPELAKPAFDDLLQHHMSAEGRVAFADKLIAAGTAIKAGRIEDGAGIMSDVLGSIKF